MENKIALYAIGLIVLSICTVPSVAADTEDYKVETLRTENIQYEEVTVFGGADLPDEDKDVHGFFEYREDDSTTWSETDRIEIENATQEFNIDLKELTNGTLHEYRAMIEWEDNQTEGSIRNFETEPFPEVNTVKVTNITHNSAVFHGNITELGMEDEVVPYFKWREKGKTQWNEKQKDGVDEESGFEGKIELDHNTSYEFKATIQWGKNETVGDIKEFETKPEVYVKTLEADYITTDSAVLRGELLGNENKIEEKETMVSFWYFGKEEWIEINKKNMDSTGEFSIKWTDIDEGTEEEFRAEVRLEGNLFHQGKEMSLNTAADFELGQIEVDPEEVYVDENIDITMDISWVEGDYDIDSYEYEVRVYIGSDFHVSDTVEVSEGSTETFEVNTSVSTSDTYDVKGRVLGKSNETEIDVYDYPEVKTSFPEEIGSDYAVLKGELLEIGLEDSVTVFFEYGEEGLNEDLWASTSKDEVTREDFIEEYEYIFEKEAAIEENLTYEYRAFVEWDENVSSGEKRFFEPESCEYHDWENQTCGGWNCEDDEIHQTQEVTDDSPGFCGDLRRRCIEAPVYCSEPDINLILEDETITVAQGKWGIKNITVENTGTEDLTDLTLDIEANISDEWFDIVTPSLDVTQTEKEDFQVNFTPDYIAPVDKYTVKYVVDYGPTKSIEGEMWVHPDEQTQEEIRNTHSALEEDIEKIEEDIERLKEEIDVEHVENDLSQFKQLLDDAEEDMDSDNFVTAKEKIDEAETLLMDIREEIQKLEEDLEFPWIEIALGLIGIFIIGLLIYLLLPPVEGYESGNYSNPSDESTMDKMKESWGNVKERIVGEEDLSYTYKG